MRQRTASATASVVTVMTRVDGSAVTSYLMCLRPAGAVVIRPANSRSVAQPGRAPRSGRGGRRFKSCHSDQYLAQIPTRAAKGCAKASRDEARTQQPGRHPMAKGYEELELEQKNETEFVLSKTDQDGARKEFLLSVMDVALLGRLVPQI